MPDRLGLIPAARLESLPKKHWKAHEFCFHIHDIMVQSLTEVESDQLNFVKINLKNKSQLTEFSKLKGESLLSFLETEGFNDEVKRILTNQVAIGVFSDMLHYVYESLCMLEKRKFSVALSLLRKPLKENLLYLSWLCGDEDNFYASFSNPVKLMNSRSINHEKRIDIFKNAIEKTSMQEHFNAEVINEVIWDKRKDGNLAILFDKATHLVTTMGRNMQTETQNFNFVFKDYKQDDIYDALYHRLAYLLIFTLNVQFALYKKMDFNIDKFQKWSKLSLWGAYEALFIKGSPKFYRAVSKAFQNSNFFSCPHCDHEIRILKPNVPDFFITQTVHCSSCNRPFQFPLFWLMSKTNLEFV